MKNIKKQPTPKGTLSAAVAGICMLFAIPCFANKNAMPRCPAIIENSPRIAVISAFSFEGQELIDSLQNKRFYTCNGIRFTTGTFENKPVVSVLTNVSMTNSAMVTQMLIDKFNVQKIIFSGVGGGVNPDLFIGDVVIPKRWALYQESFFARDMGGHFEAPSKGLAAGLGLELSDYHDLNGENAEINNFGMIFTRNIATTSANNPQYPNAAGNGICIPSLNSPSGQVCGIALVEHKFWFDVDADMLSAAEQVLASKYSNLNSPLRNCLNYLNNNSIEEICIDDQNNGRKPQLVIDGNGVSGPTFVDNLEYREYVFNTYTYMDGNDVDRVNVLDMETAAAAHVAHTNSIPFLAIRTISDLAGADAGQNVLPIFLDLAIQNTSMVVKDVLRNIPVND